jgi:hypothetical protein
VRTVGFSRVRRTSHHAGPSHCLLLSLLRFENTENANSGTEICSDPTIRTIILFFRCPTAHRGRPIVSLTRTSRLHGGLLSAGTPVKTVSKRLGHANATVTMNIYAHLLSGDDEAPQNMSKGRWGSAHLSLPLRQLALRVDYSQLAAPPNQTPDRVLRA